MAIAGFAIFLLGIIFVIVSPINKRKNARCSAQTQGTLQEIRKWKNSKGHNRHTYIYSYNVNGIEYKMKSTILSSEIKRTGDSCTIWYDPAKPKKAQPFHYESSKVYTIILVIGIVMVLAGFVLMGIGLSR